MPCMHLWHSKLSSKFPQDFAKKLKTLVKKHMTWKNTYSNPALIVPHVVSTDSAGKIGEALQVMQANGSANTTLILSCQRVE